MQVDVLTLRYDPSRGVLDDTALREFTRDKVVLAVRDHFYQVGNTPQLTLVIEYRLPAPGPGARPEPAGRRDGGSTTRDLRETLPQGERELIDLVVCHGSADRNSVSALGLGNLSLGRSTARSNAEWHP